MGNEFRYTEMEKRRALSAIFSRKTFADLLEFGDYDKFEIISRRYPLLSGPGKTYWDYLRSAYRYIKRHYRSEYVFKNEFLTQVLLKQYGTLNTAVFSEFRIVHSVADVALFNGESKAYEIKTEYDSPARLSSQLAEYSKLFDKSYLITSEACLDKYLPLLSERTGVMVMADSGGRPVLEMIRESEDNESLDVETLIKSLHTSEYKNIVRDYYGEVPEVSSFQMFNACRELLAGIPEKELRQSFLREIKKRKNNTASLRKIPPEIRQVFLSMRLGEENVETIKQLLDNPINRN